MRKGMIGECFQGGLALIPRALQESAPCMKRRGNRKVRNRGKARKCKNTRRMKEEQKEGE